MLGCGFDSLIVLVYLVLNAVCVVGCCCLLRCDCLLFGMILVVLMCCMRFVVFLVVRFYLSLFVC